jgi:hypothetical protein
MRAPLTNFADVSIEPVSTATIESTGKVCEVREVTTSGNQT